MKKPISKSIIYVSGAARFKDLLYVIGKDRKLAANDVEHARFIAFDDGTFCHSGDRNWSAVAICVVKKPTEKMVAIGEDGEVYTYVGGTDADEIIKPAPICLRGITVVDGFAYACGMKRQVYKRDGEDSWVAMHAPAGRKGDDTGFEAIAGFSPEEIYAVGWTGEIWEWNGSKWLNRDSPTNLILTGVCCAGDKKVYVCGQNGSLLRGRHDSWDVIDLEEFTDDFWDIHWFKKKVYLATMTELYTYAAAGLEPVDFGDDLPASCYRLTDAEGVLWSIGSDDIFSFDGTDWTRVD